MIMTNFNSFRTEWTMIEQNKGTASTILGLAFTLRVLNCCNYPFGQVSFTETVYGSVGSTFSHKLKCFYISEPTTDRKQIELLTADENVIFESPWIGLDREKRTIYGFPLKGNRGKSTYFVRITTYETQKKSCAKINVVIGENFNQIRF